MSTTHRRDRGQHESMVGYYLAAAVFALLGIIYVCWRAGCWLTGQPGPVLINPATAAVGSNVDPNLGNNVASISVGIQPATTTTIDLTASFIVAPPATASATSRSKAP